MENKRDYGWAMAWVVGIVLTLVCLALIFGLIWGWKSFKVWSRAQDGRAELAEAEWNRKIQIEEAQANLESQKLNALSEIERAKGAAESNRIIGDGLKGNDEYLRYLWIQQVADNDGIIYVPTEAGLPILEAGKRN